MENYEKLLLANKAWAQDKLELSDTYFQELSNSQSPDFLWIGCSDSRVSAEELTGAEPGEMFVHRNIANLVVSNDLNLLSVLQYAVEVLKVRHVIVCGHYLCGGVQATINNKPLGLIDEWLGHIKAVETTHADELARLPTEQARFDRLVELNVQTQIDNLARTASIQKMWAEGKQPSLHGWVFDLRTGILKDVYSLFPGQYEGNTAQLTRGPQPDVEVDADYKPIDLDGVL
jgi:carbonic anhydrase